jgi:hypothetical protein
LTHAAWTTLVDAGRATESAGSPLAGRLTSVLADPAGERGLQELRSWMARATDGATSRAHGEPQPDTTEVGADGVERTSFDNQRFVPDEGEVGDGKDSSARSTEDAGGGVTMTKTVRDLQRMFVRACPDSRGIVTGEGRSRLDLDTALAAPGEGRMAIRVQTDAKAQIEAHVDDGGHLRDYDMHIVFQRHGQVVGYDAAGTVMATNPPDLVTLRVSALGIKPGMGIVKVSARNTITSVVATESESFREKLFRLSRAGNMLTIHQDRLVTWANEALEQAESGWRSGDCVSARASAAKTQLKAGESTKVTVEVLPPKGEGLAPGRLRVSLSGQGTLRPSGWTRFDRHPRTYTFTAPKKNWKKGSSADIRAKAVSRQGEAFKSVTITAKQPPRDRAYFKVTALGGSYEMRFSASRSMPPCSITGEHSYRLSINPNAEREKTDGSVKLSVGAGTIVLPTLRTGTEIYRATCDYSAGHADNPCRGPIDAPDPLDFLTITRSRGTARIAFGAPQQLWGIAPMCSQFYGDGGALANRDHPFKEATVPWSTIAGTRPFTVSADDTPNDPNHQVTRSRTITLQPVDRSGSPLR